MHKFLSTILVFTLSYFGLISLVMLLEWHTYILPNKGVYEAIRRSKSEQPNTRLLIIGDSVAKQIFDPSNKVDTVTSLACNQSIDLVGHYLLLKDFLERNPSVERIAFIYNPFSFSNDLDHKYTYNYFLKPFYHPYYTPEFTEHVRGQIDQIPYAELVNFPPVATTFWTPSYDPPSSTDQFLSVTSWEYLNKIVDLTRQKSIPLAFLSAPIKASRQEEVRQLQALYEASGRSLELLDHYFASITYVPDTLFMDDIHFQRPEEMVPIVEAQFKKKTPIKDTKTIN
jgi:hypothetical protein